MSVDASESIFRIVERSILTIPFGVALLILNSIEFPRIITDISSPIVRGNPFNLFFTKSVNSLSIVTTSFTGMSLTFFAVFTLTFFTKTTSPIAAPIFFLVCPSRRIESGFFSSSSDGHTIAQLVLVPFISIISPGATCR